jgi:hypothetical protein
VVTLTPRGRVVAWAVAVAVTVALVAGSLAWDRARAQAWRDSLPGACQALEQNTGAGPLPCQNY